MISFGERCYSNQYYKISDDDISDDEISASLNEKNSKKYFRKGRRF